MKALRTGRLQIATAAHAAEGGGFEERPERGLGRDRQIANPRLLSLVPPPLLNQLAPRGNLFRRNLRFAVSSTCLVLDVQTLAQGS